MKTIISSYGNSGGLGEARREVWKKKPFRYIVIETSGGTPGAIGGSFTYVIRGTNTLKELLKPSIFRDCDEVLDTKEGKEITKTHLAKLYLKSLSRKQKAALVEKALLKFLAD